MEIKFLYGDMYVLTILGVGEGVINPNKPPYLRLRSRAYWTLFKL